MLIFSILNHPCFVIVYNDLFDATRIIFHSFSPADMSTVDVLTTVNWITLANLYKCSLIKLFYKGYHGMLPRTLAEELIVYSNRSSRMKHRLPVLPPNTLKTLFPIEGLSSGTL